MADDPDRDILPVKEGSFCADTLISAIDPRERHLVCKLDRYQLEDKYLRLLDEASNLKKLSNCQEDKIKRLGTKLIRLAGNPRSGGLSLDITGDDKNRMSVLELENSKLKEKIAVMRNQLLSHTMSGRSSSRSRNLVRPTSSGLVTCRSENNRSRVPSCQCIADGGHDDNDVRNYLVKIEKLEAQKKDMTARITDLEKELAVYSASSQREKVADNVEYIRVWRQMKQLNEKLITAQDKNAALTVEMNDLKTTVEQTTRNNHEIAAVLTSERTRIAEMDDQVMKAKNSHLALREKEERIRDLASEMKILQQHNNELIALSSKYGQVEAENGELKRRLIEQAQDQQSLRTAFNNDQANLVALQATNEQLLAKLQDLQATIDTLSVQLASLQKQNERRDAAMTALSNAAASKKEGEPSEQVHSVPVKQCKTCCEMYDKVSQLEKAVDGAWLNRQPSAKSVQTISSLICTKEQGVMTSPDAEERTSLRLQSPLKERKMNHETNSLSREKILKLLDQAQINAPLDASRIAQKEEYTDILGVAQTQRHSDGEVPLQTQRDEPNSARKGSRMGRLSILENMPLSQALLMLIDVLHEHLSLNITGEETPAKRPVFVLESTQIDVNNNLAKSDNLNLSADKNACSCKYQQTEVPDDRGVDIDERNHKNAKIKCCPPSLEAGRHLSCIPEEEAVSTKTVGSSARETQDKATCCPVINDEVRRSSDQLDSNNGYVEKVKIVSSPRCDLMCHLGKRKDSSTERQKRTTCKSKCLGNQVQLSIGSAESFPLLITDKQGLLEVHVLQLQLSMSASKISGEKDLRDLCVFVSWDIGHEQTAYTMAMRCPNLNFNFSSVYRIADLFSFFNNVLLEYLVFGVNVVRPDDKKFTVARARVSIRDILDYPQSKLHYIVPVNSIVSSSCGLNFGQLSLWVRLSCNVEIVEAFKEQCGITLLRNSAPRDAPDVHFSSQVDQPKEWRTNGVATLVSTNDSSHEAVNPDEGNYVTSSSKETSSPTPTSETKQMFEEEGGRRPARRRPDSEVTTVDGRERPTERHAPESPSITEFNSIMTNELEEDTIIIEIVSALFFDSVIQNVEISLIFVEYSFLGYCGENMESISVEKPRLASQEVFFNFRKKFRIDDNTVERENLRAMLTDYISPNVTFVIVSEPLPEKTMIKECVDIGFATFNVKEYALGDGHENVSLSIRDNQRRDIGVLKIIVLGFDAIKQCLADVQRNIFQ